MTIAGKPRNSLRYISRFILCVVISGIGIFHFGLFAALANQNNAILPIEPPKLNIRIPGLTLATNVTMKGGEVVKIPFLAQYIAGIYRYIVGASVVAAAVMIVYGGFLYILGSSMMSVKRGKEVIQDALVGLFLVLGAFTILQTVNSQLNTSYKTIDILTVKKDMEHMETLPVNSYWKAINASKKSASPSGQTAVTPGGTGGGGGGTGGGGGESASPAGKEQPSGQPAPTPDAPKGNSVQSGPCTLELNSLKIPTKESIYRCAILVAKEVGLHPCVMVVILNHESWDGLPNSIGFDENAPNGRPRLDFLRSGRYSYPKDPPEKFTPPDIPPVCKRKELEAKGMEEGLIKETIAKCEAAANSPIKNNDIKNFDPTKPDLGFTWRYSIGVGLMQTTIFKSSWCNGGPSWKPPGSKECYTPQQLLDTYTGLKAGALELKANSNKGLEGMFKAWNQSESYYKGLTRETETCIQSNIDAIHFMLGPLICRGDFEPYSVKACKAENKEREKFNKTAKPEEKKWLIRKDCANVCYDPRNPLTSSMIKP